MKLQLYNIHKSKTWGPVEVCDGAHVGGWEVLQDACLYILNSQVTVHDPSQLETQSLSNESRPGRSLGFSPFSEGASCISAISPTWWMSPVLGTTHNNNIVVPSRDAVCSEDAAQCFQILSFFLRLVFSWLACFCLWMLSTCQHLFPTNFHQRPHRRPLQNHQMKLRWDRIYIHFKMYDFDLIAFPSWSPLMTCNYSQHWNCIFPSSQRICLQSSSEWWYYSFHTRQWTLFSVPVSLSAFSRGFVLFRLRLQTMCIGSIIKHEERTFKGQLLISLVPESPPEIHNLIKSSFRYSEHNPPPPAGAAAP